MEYQQHIRELIEEKAARAESLRLGGKPYLAKTHLEMNRQLEEVLRKMHESLILPTLPRPSPSSVAPPSVSRAEFDELAREVERLKAERPQGYRRAG